MAGGWGTAGHTPTNAAAAAFSVPEAAAAAGLEEPCLVSGLTLWCIPGSPGPAAAAFKWPAWLGFRSREPRADVSPAAAAAPYFGKLNIWLLLPSFGALLPGLPSVPVMQSTEGGWG